MEFYIFAMYVLLLSSIQSLPEEASSDINIWPLGISFQPANSIELLSNYTTDLFFYCISECNVDPQCRTFVYDSTSNQCILYEGAISTGITFQSNSSTIQMGSIEYSTDLYKCFNKTKDQCQFNRYLVENTTSYVGICPENTYWDGTMCLNQVYYGTSCTFDEMCRTDMNLACNNITTRTCGGAYKKNLVKNGDAETGPCEDGDDVTHPTFWSYYGSVTQSTYTNTYATLSTSTPGPSDHGNCYFSGFFGSYTYMFQTISLVAYSPEIDLNKVSFDFSVWTGGWQYQDDSATHLVSFYDSSNLILGNTTIAPVYANDRQNITELLFRQVTGMIPIHTRSLTIFIVMTSTTFWNDASVDDISFKLHYIP